MCGIFRLQFDLHWIVEKFLSTEINIRNILVQISLGLLFFDVVLVVFYYPAILDDTKKKKIIKM